MARAKALAGTPAASQACRCGHTKIRHTNRGRDRCAGLNASSAPAVHRPAHANLDPCQCATFTPDRED